MKVYTKKGDTGNTSIIGGQRHKGDLRVEAYGSVDEALAVIGEILTLSNLPKKTRAELLMIINKLFDMNRALATIETTHFISEDDVLYLENSIDYMDRKLSSLTNFILPIGDTVFTKLNYARTIIRRAERNTTRLAQSETIDLILIKYLNRLSDYFFVASRYANYCNQKKEIYKHF